MTYTTEQIHTAIAYHGSECERALRLAANADAGFVFAPDMAEGFRKLAAIHSDDAFAWARHLRPEGGAA